MIFRAVELLRPLGAPEPFFADTMEPGAFDFDGKDKPLLPSNVAVFIASSQGPLPRPLQFTDMAKRYHARFTDSQLRSVFALQNKKPAELTRDQLVDRIALFRLAVEFAGAFLADGAFRKYIADLKAAGNTTPVPNPNADNLALALFSTISTDYKKAIEEAEKVLAGTTLTPSMSLTSMTPSLSLTSMTPSMSLTSMTPSLSVSALLSTSTTKTTPSGGIFGLSEEDSKKAVYGLIGLAVLIVVIIVVLAAS